ncbi:hypothetical protein ACN26Z_14845 [Verrucosispora sp. WMMD703]|uniref:hypothetical protein n=1 Tax=Verrucosispora sp. WMMD703 TaxID=3403463 RepID=UPI003B92E278
MMGRRQQQEEAQGCNCRIALADVVRAFTDTGIVSIYWTAARMKGVADDLGIDTAPDWSGRPSVTPADAARLRVEVQAQRDRQHAQAQAAANAAAAQTRALHASATGGFKVTTLPGPPVQ